MTECGKHVVKRGPSSSVGSGSRRCERKIAQIDHGFVDFREVRALDLGDGMALA